MSVRDWGTIGKTQQKLKKELVLSSICWNFEKKLEKYFWTSWKFWKSEKIFKKHR